MPDLRKITYPERFWMPDERAYIRHLEEHETNAKFPKPLPGDSQAIKDLFRLIGTSERAAQTARELIIALRKAGKGMNDQVKEEIDGDLHQGAEGPA
jgi:hypothetical protein